MILIDTQKEEFSKLRDIRVFGRISHDDRFNGNLLVIGLGGIGSSSVTNILTYIFYANTILCDFQQKATYFLEVLYSFSYTILTFYT